MQEKLFAGKDPDTIKQMLIDNCDDTDEGGYIRHLTHEEVAARREAMADAHMKLYDIQVEAKLAAAAFKEEAKPIQEQIAEDREAIRTRSVQETGTLYMFADHESGHMGYYDEKGELVNSRRLRPDERQATVQGGIRATRRETVLN